MCQLWCHIHSTLETRWNGALFVQCLRSVPQNEWHESSSYKTAPKIGKVFFLNLNEQFFFLKCLEMLSLIEIRLPPPLF